MNPTSPPIADAPIFIIFEIASSRVRDRITRSHGKGHRTLRRVVVSADGPISIINCVAHPLDKPRWLPVLKCKIEQLQLQYVVHWRGARFFRASVFASRPSRGELLLLRAVLLGQVGGVFRRGDGTCSSKGAPGGCEAVARNRRDLHADRCPPREGARPSPRLPFPQYHLPR